MERFLNRKLNSGLLKDIVQREGWKLIFFRDLKKFYNENEKKTEIALETFLQIINTPIEERKKTNYDRSFHGIRTMKLPTRFLN